MEQSIEKSSFKKLIEVLWKQKLCFIFFFICLILIHIIYLPDNLTDLLGLVITVLVVDNVLELSFTQNLLKSIKAHFLTSIGVMLVLIIYTLPVSITDLMDGKIGDLHLFESFDFCTLLASLGLSAILVVLLNEAEEKKAELNKE